MTGKKINMKFKDNLTPEDKINIYSIMKKIRFFEKAVFQLTTEGFIFGSIHSYIGEEAIAAGVAFCINQKDYIISTHRCHGHFIAKGADMNKMMAELMGKVTGYCRGKGGSMHLAAPEINFMGANGIVGAGISIATGLGFACKNFIKKDRLVVCFFGDGAINTGSFHESLNLSSVWGLPVLFICENNQYAISTAVNKASSVKDLSLRAKAYGIKGFRIDGNNVMDVINHVNTCIEIIKNKQKPVLLVCDTYRHMGHSIHDSKIYRTKKEEDAWILRDPVINFENLLVRENIIDKSLIIEIENSILAEINQSIEFAKNSLKPDLSELYQNIFSE